MTHRRTLVFDGLLALLRQIPDFAAAGKAERGRTDPIVQEALPALTLSWADDEETAAVRPQAAPDGADGYDRVLPVSVIVHLRDADPDTEFDRLAALIEAKLGANMTVGGVAIDVTLQSSRFFVDPQTGLPLCVGRLVYRVHYTTLAADPGAAGII